MSCKRPDPLAGLGAAARRRKEAEDAAYIMQANAGRCVADQAALAKPDPSFAGNRAIAAADLKPYEPGADNVDVVVCARVDLEHPIYFPDNLFANCADCACDLQYRPVAPAAGDKLCICCAADRLRAEGRQQP